LTERKIYFVGAGPGDPKLLTIRAFELLHAADVVIYDRLVSQEILDLIPNNVERIYVGKLPQCKGGISQSEINTLLIENARSGKLVVRLKGGDPLIFSRGGEEAEALMKEKLQFEIIPGVSSALAAPAYAGIPLTHRGYSSSVAIVTGHEDPSKISSKVDWAKLASAVDTIVILMGVGRLKQIAEELTQAGLEGSTPVAAIESASTDAQRTLLFTLQQTQDVLPNISSPSVIVIGEVAALARNLRWNSGTLIDHISRLMPTEIQIIT
jgi:uroporphyrin-III C-methyltransferase